MSTLKVNTIQNTSAAHSSTPEEIAQGRAKAWVNFNGLDTIAIRDSFNVSSLTDNGTGDYTVTFSNAMSNANYCAVASGILDASGDTSISSVFVFNFTTTTIKLKTFRLQNNSAAPRDFEQISVAVFGDQ